MLIDTDYGLPSCSNLCMNDDAMLVRVLLLLLLDNMCTSMICIQRLLVVLRYQIGTCMRSVSRSCSIPQ